MKIYISFLLLLSSSLKVRPALAQAWRSFLDYNPHDGVLAMVTQLGEVLEVYNLKDSMEVIRIVENGNLSLKYLKDMESLQESWALAMYK